jgi:hypothetical protein
MIPRLEPAGFAAETVDEMAEDEALELGYAVKKPTRSILKPQPPLF